MKPKENYYWLSCLFDFGIWKLYQGW